MKYLVIGGTGTLGKELVGRLLQSDSVDVFSRDEYKQSAMAKVYPNVNYILGDIREWNDLSTVHFPGYDAVFNCAAMKHVDLGETNVEQFFKTNTIGAINVAKKCHGRSKLVFFSTDKAVMPVNAYGMSKAIAEKYIQSCGADATIFRWGNILGSRGSILDYFAKIIKNGGEVPITDKRMTRFWLTIHEAIDYVVDNWRKGVAKKPMIPAVKGAKVVDIAKAIGAILDRPVKMKIVGIRPGEKIHECLNIENGYEFCSDNCEQFEMDELIVKIRQAMGR
jgi:UDP-N-acetylglucosamine 4,6-dehydratase